MRTGWTSSLRLSKTSGLLFLILTSIVGFRLPSCLTPIWNVDEAVSACIANEIVDGGLPYRDAIDHRGPVTYYAYALVFAVFGKNNMTALHLMLAVLLSGIGGLVYRCGSMLGTPRTGVFAAWFFSTLSFGLYQKGDLLAAHTEFWVIAFTSLAAYCLLRSLPGNNWSGLLCCGVCYGGAFLAKQPALLDVVATVCFLGLLVLCRQSPLHVFGQRVILIGTGFFFVITAVLTYFATHGALDDFIFYVWTYNTRYYIPEVTWLQGLQAMPVPFVEMFRKFFLILLAFFSGAAFLIYQFWASPRIFGTRRTERLMQHDYGLFFVLSACASLLAAALSGRNFGHYYIQLFPAMSVVAGVAGDELGMLGVKVFQQCARPALRVLLQAVLGTCLVALLLPLAARFYASFPEKDIDPSMQQLTDYIKATSTPDNQIFVWGFYPEIYVLSERTPASRYTFTNVLTGLIPWTNTAEHVDTTYAIVPGTWDILMAELAANMPLLIVDASPVFRRSFGKYPLTNFPLLQNFITQQYTPAHDVLSETGELVFRVFRRK